MVEPVTFDTKWSAAGCYNIILRLLHIFLQSIAIRNFRMLLLLLPHTVACPPCCYYWGGN
jgi:hypothetical protein